MSDRSRQGDNRRYDIAVRGLGIWLVVAIVVSSGGCGKKGPDVQFVEGRVMLDGQPLGNATIGFTCTEKPGIAPAYGVTDDSGVYRLTSIGGGHQQGAVTGTFVVTVTKFETEKTEAGEGGAAFGPPPKSIRITPEIYGDVATSPLRATVHRGENKGPDYEFNLEPKPRKTP